MTYAKIKDNEVINVISLRQAQAHEFPDCIPVNDILVEPGDVYENGKFYRDGVELKTPAQLLSEAEEFINIILGGNIV